jgi:elongator complex protein 3
METAKILKKPVRSASGVVPITVVLKPRKCDHGTCIYCPGGEKVPQSYTDKSPAVMRALSLGFDPHEQVKNRLGVLNMMGHPTDKIEIIILGGTFMQYPKKYRDEFIKRCFDALNGKDSKSIGEAKKSNETAEHRCVAMCIENRPDNCSKEEIEEMLSYGCTRVELGVQMPDDNLYRKTNRGHKVKDVIEATKRLKNAGFKIGYHMMPGLPYSSMEKDLELFGMIFKSENFRPDQLKIYPCQVVEDSPLAKTYKIIGFRPYSENQAREIMKEMVRMIPEYCRVMRMMREFPREKTILGLTKLDLRKDIEKEFRDSGEKVKEIRMREIGFNQSLSELGQTGEIGFNKNVDEHVRLKMVKYRASGGREIFLEVVNRKNVLFGLLRLRLGRGGAMVRELHVYGQAINLGKKGKAAQHHGFGKWLMEEAEKMARKSKRKKISVISGVGVREYYRELGYELEGNYMVKRL